MKEKWFVFVLLTLVLLDSALIFAEESHFVTAQGKYFYIDGKIFMPVGANCYYLHYKSDKAIDDIFRRAVLMNLKVIRCWGFMDGQEKENILIQPSLGEYNETDLCRLDYAIAKAKENGIRLIITLTNNWSDFGGIPQYAEWVSGTHDEFYSSSTLKNSYKNYISFILNHSNSYTKTSYKNEPTIMAWELCNECRSDDTTGNLILSWAQEMSDYIKTIDTNHLVAVGDEGFFKRTSDDWTYNGSSGVDWERLIALSSIDFGTFHLYPDSWEKDSDWGVQWILDHRNAAIVANKPAILEEYGWKNKSTRDQVYTKWLDTASENELSGHIFWILTGIDNNGELYPDYDGFRIEYPSSTATVITKHTMSEKAVIRDFDADGKTDIPWRQTTGTAPGTNKIWIMDGSSVKENITVNKIGTDWTVSGMGDFNNDGKADVLWRLKNGSNVMWIMNGTTITEVYTIKYMDTIWKQAGIADFDGDGKSDILWYKADGNSATCSIWFMNSGEIVKEQTIGLVDSRWKVGGVGDFDGDGKSDILWRLDDYTNILWLIDSDTNGIKIKEMAILDYQGNTWTIAGTGDFNGDSRTDIFWRSSTGVNTIWFMNGKTIVDKRNLDSLSATSKVAEIGDFDGDTKCDILWRTTPKTTIWFTNGESVTKKEDIAISMDSAWNVVGGGPTSEGLDE